LSTTLFNYRRTLADTISTSNAFFYKVKKNAAWKEVASIGDRCAIPLMYELGSADFYSGYDQLDVTPMDGLTTAFWSWSQMAVPITISRLEERKNSGEEQLINLLESKTQQALLGIQDLFGRALLQGDGPHTATSITTPYTSVYNGATGFDPLPLLVKYDPTSSTSIGNINQSTYTWWANQYLADTSSTYAGFLKNLRNLRNKCSKGPGGVPDLHVCGQYAYELYEAALAAQHRNPSYQRADIPFDNIAFYGDPVVWDQFMPDVANGTIASIPVQASDSWFMLNTKFFEIRVDSETNFMNTPFIRPENQDAKTAHILWLGCVTVSNRRKQGVMGSIDGTIAA
jgi:hypothetical protein